MLDFQTHFFLFITEDARKTTRNGKKILFTNFRTISSLMTFNKLGIQICACCLLSKMTKYSQLELKIIKCLPFRSVLSKCN